MASSNHRRSFRARAQHAFIERIEPRQLMSAVVFQVDASRSSVSVSGHVSAFNLQEQAPGSLTTNYAGTIAADVEGGSITFPEGSAVAAQDNGSWNPGNAPGNYGAKFNTGLLGTEYVAARGMSLDLTSGALPISGTGSFDLNSATVKFLSGTIDYAPVTSGSSDLTGESGQQQSADLAQYSVSGNTATLVLPVHVTVTQTFFTPNDSQLTLSGEVVATADLTPPQVASASFQFDRLPQTLAFTFTQDVSASLSPAALQLVNLTTAQAVVPDGYQYSAGNTATFRFDHPLPDGRYRATLLSSAITNATGVHLGNGSDYTYDFFTLTGDVNHDGSVGFSDLLVLAQHYGTAGTFSAGDVNYDGTVGFADLLLMAQNYGKSLPNPSAASLTDSLWSIRARRVRVHL